MGQEFSWLLGARRPRMWLGPAALLLAAGGLAAALPRVVGAGAQQPFGGQVIRFHVIANSDRPADQAIKLKVRDALIADLAPALEGARTAGQVRRLLLARRGRMEEIGRETLRRLGSPDPVRVEVGRFPFPAREAGGVLFPPGTYEAVRVVIGRGAGRNWWCVLYPAMCFSPRIDGADGEPLIGHGPAGGAAQGEAAAGPSVHAFKLMDGSVVLADEGRPVTVPVEVRSAVADWLSAARQRFGLAGRGGWFARRH